MEKQKAALTLLLTLCFVAVCFPDFRAAEGNFTEFPLPEPAYIIKSDGSVDPATAPIRRDGDVYTLTGNIVGYTIRVERDSVTLDGGGYGLIGNVKPDNYTLRVYGDPVGVFMLNRRGVTVRNMKISNFAYGIHIFSYLGSSSNSRLENNVVTDNYYGIYIASASSTVLRNNRMQNNIFNFCAYENDQAENDIDSSNTVDEKRMIYWFNKHGETVPSDAGYVVLVNCSNMTVQNLDLTHNGQGIDLSSTTDTLITNNHITHTDWGIHIYNSANVLVTENILESNNIGITAGASSNNKITANNITRNNKGVGFSSPSQNNIISGNNITANTEEGVILHGLIDNTVEQNIIADNGGTGVSMLYSHNNRITANTITGNGHDGIRLWENSTENTISKNAIANNKVGIRIRETSNNSITENTFTDNNSSALHLTGSQTNNTIYHNNFYKQNGEQQVAIPIEKSWSGTKPEGVNVWDNGTTGNYWSDYTGTDADGDGVGDTPYALSEKNSDRYPLTAPFEVDTSNAPPLPTPDAASEPPPTTLLIASAILVAATSSSLIVYLIKRKRYTAPASLQA